MVSERLIKQLITHEGYREKPYLCSAGKVTIGIGRNIEDNGLSEDEVLYLLKNDIKRTTKELSQYKWFPLLNDNRRNAIIDMHFNLGQSRFSGFKNMISALENKDYTKAADEMLNSKWARQVGKRAETLANMMRIG